MRRCSLADSPVGLAPWFVRQVRRLAYSDGDPERSLTKDEMLDDITLYWLTNTATSGGQVLDGIGHNVPQQAPDAFADAVLEVGGAR
jgi:hypothetical protein